MAVDIKSLRIGSHVSFGCERVKVIGIGSSGLIEFKNTDGDLFRVLANDVEPIAITAELLEELGFENRDNTYWERWFKGSFDIEKKEDSHYFDYGEIRLEYLHELENLYSLIYDDELIKE